jgi:serine O-acetyltransferase
MALWGSIYRDYRRYRAAGDRCFEVLLLCQGFWASVAYRISRSLCQLSRRRWIRAPFVIAGAFVQLLMEIITGISIPAQADIGDGLYIGHFGNIILPAHGRIGRNCNVSQGVTIGAAGVGGDRGAPIIGDRVYIGPNAVVVGKITIGNDAKICAGSVVNRSVPPCAVVMGNPARVISYEGSFNDVAYDGMETDPDRMAALESDVRIRASMSPAILAS